MSINSFQAAMAELMAGWDNKPTPALLEAYNQWSQGGWGAILTGSLYGTPSPKR